MVPCTDEEYIEWQSTVLRPYLGLCNEIEFRYFLLARDDVCIFTLRKEQIEKCQTYRLNPVALS